MLSPGIHGAYEAGVAALAAHPEVRERAAAAWAMG